MTTRPAQIWQLTLIGLLLLYSDRVQAQPAEGKDVVRTDAQAMTSLFGADLLDANARSVDVQAMQMPAAERYGFVKNYVWPEAFGNRPRFTGWLSPADLQNRTGGEVRSPVLTLVEVAQLTSRTDSLVEEIRQSADSSNYAHRCRYALLALLELSRDRTDKAGAFLDELYALTDASGKQSLKNRWPELLVASVAWNVPELQRLVGELLAVLTLRDDSTNALDIRNQALALLGKVNSNVKGGRFEGTDGNTFASAVELRNWIPVSMADAEIRSKGHSLAEWQISPGQAISVAGHSHDALMYRIPLEGDYEVEADVATYGGSISQLSVGGRWVTLSGEAILKSGVFRGTDTDVLIDPPIVKRPYWSRFRVVARDGRFTVSINGRKVHEYSGDADRDPWLTIRNVWKYSSGFQDIRITGKPTIPDEIALLKSAYLPGWRKYIPRISKWIHSDDHPNGSVTGTRYDEPMTGADVESLLYYRRPMLEDGEIGYEFFYEPGVAEVHPAIGLQAFMLQPNGVQIHEVTDGMFDRTVDGLSDLIDEPESRRGPAKLPLLSGEWNRMKLTLVGDTIELALNGEPVFSRNLDSNYRSSFGLFHYADRTEARVRNLVWRGDWPKELPPVAQQQMAGPDHESLAGLDGQFKEVERFRLATQASDPRVFEFTGSTWKDAIAPEAGGLKVSMTDAPSWRVVRMTMKEPLYGDFDAIATFDQLVSSPGVAGNDVAVLRALDDSSFIVSCSRNTTGDGQERCSSKLSVPTPDGTLKNTGSHITDASTAGSLRLVRRGEIMHMLISDEGSTKFRYAGRQLLPSAGSAINLQLLTNTTLGGTVSIRWKELVIRSNSKADAKLRDPRVSALNQYTSVLPGSDRHTFSLSGLTDFTANAAAQGAADSEGLHTRLGPVNGPVEPAILAYDKGFSGDFDVSVLLKAKSFPVAVNDSPSLSFSLVFGEADREQVQMHIRRKSADSIEVVAQQLAGDSDEPTVRKVATELLQDVDGLRLIRIQKTIFFLCSEAGIYRVLGQTNVGAGPVASGGVRLEVQPPRSGEPETEVIWKMLKLRSTALN